MLQWFPVPSNMIFAHGDANASYFMFPYEINPNIEIVIKGQYPRARYFSFVVGQDADFPIATAHDQILIPDPGCVNPFLPCANWDARNRNYTLVIRFTPPPCCNPYVPCAGNNTIYAGSSRCGQSNKNGQILLRIYVPSVGYDKTGGVGLPDIQYRTVNACNLLPCECLQSAIEKISCINDCLHGGCNLKECGRCDCCCDKCRPKDCCHNDCCCEICRSKDCCHNDCCCDKCRPKDCCHNDCCCDKCRPKDCCHNDCCCDKCCPKDCCHNDCCCDKCRPKDCYCDVLWRKPCRCQPKFFLFNPEAVYMISDELKRKCDQLLFFRFKTPTFPDTWHNMGIEGNENMRYWSMVFYSECGAFSLRTLSDFQTTIDRYGYINLVISFGTPRPLNVTTSNGFTWVDLSDLPCIPISILYCNLLASPTFPCTAKCVPDGEIVSPKVMGEYYPCSKYVDPSFFKLYPKCLETIDQRACQAPNNPSPHS